MAEKPDVAITSPATAASVIYNASYRHKPEAEYPWSARHMNQQGVAKVAVQVGADGLALTVRLVKSSGVDTLDEAAESALHDCRDCFVPPQRDGKPVTGWVLVPMEFRLGG